MRPDAADPRRLAPPSGSTCGCTPSCPPAAPGIHGSTTPDGPDLSGRALDPHDLKAAYGRFATGVAFVEAEVEGTRDGLIVSSFAAVSLEPALISFCPARTSITWRRMRATKRFDVHVLGTQHSVFARAGRADRSQQPLEDPLASFACTLEAEHPAGDHWIVLGRVHEVRLAEDPDPLVYFTSTFHSLEQK